jgi:signal transduction histidine kinase
MAQPDTLEAELLGVVSHELRTPLAAIKGYATTLLRYERRLPRAERYEFLEAIGQASERLQVVIDRLLEISELEAGAVRLERFPMDVARLVDEAVLSMRERTERESGGLATAQYLHGAGQYTFIVTREDGAAGNTPLLVVGDTRRLRHVLDHVLENAVKYSPSGGTIQVTLHTCTAWCDGLEQPMDSEGPTPHDAVVEIEIRDPGMGIPAEHLDRVFERFHRIDKRLAREAEGMGLGLAIARRIVELHGGMIWAESTPGNGSAFHICLPLATQAELDALDQPAKPSTEATNQPTTPAARR